MKLYLLRGEYSVMDGSENRDLTDIYGVFSTMEKAQKIMNDLRINVREHGEQELFYIDELTLDEPTEYYEFMMAN